MNPPGQSCIEALHTLILYIYIFSIVNAHTIKCQIYPNEVFYTKDLLPTRVTTLNSAYNKKKYAEILLHYRWLFVKGDVFIGVWHVFGTEVFLHYSQFFVKGDFIIGRVECI